MYRLLKSGDEASYKKLFLEYYQPLTAFAFKFVADLDTAKDIVQSVFIKIYEKRERLLVEQSIKSYLYRAVSNACINHIKKENIRSAHHSAYAEEMADAFFHDSMEQTEAEHKIFKALNDLPPQCRKIFMMSRLDNRKNRDIADELSISIRTVETQISNALRTLKKVISIFL
jgi:RNA polymerase sigma-70 factor (ECF subfamily)